MTSFGAGAVRPEEGISRDSIDDCRLLIFERVIWGSAGFSSDQQSKIKNHQSSIKGDSR
jgi:hypothetical protein